MRKMLLSVILLLHKLSFCSGQVRLLENGFEGDNVNVTLFAKAVGPLPRSGINTNASSEMSSMNERFSESNWLCSKICWILGDFTFLHYDEKKKKQLKVSENGGCVR